MRLASPRPLLLAAALCIVPPLAAQTVQGTLLAEDGETPLPGARVALVGVGGAGTAEVTTDGEGRFTLTAAAPGMYRVRAVPAGGAAMLFAPVTLAAGERKELEFQAHAPTAADSVYALAPLTATAERRRALLERHGFYQRQHQYPGRFLTHDDFVRLHGLRPIEKILDLGISMEPHGSGRFLLYRVQITGGADSPHGRCYLSVYIDGAPVNDIPLTQLTEREIAAVEYYTRDNIPPEFNPMLGDPGSRCGSLAIWTEPPSGSTSSAASPAP
ncbi:carboxypeptidase-like regulatory domain-containing protein [Longimicrobium sp.]|uniref:carboxypeptidase-like regulatory domain-containing protein n=1 Tax=Longimicrobium sp. TaxID=2029185 RepID=UPI002CEE2ADD|nr:carboxypeptidase-like regulatory domain-containing protein [Longimicrobium sp.]HSU17310.1 carboxypeptidase-like regulatory domain-containing protein [Longimicrobium sp.]